MTKNPRITISRPPWARKKGCKEPHYIISVNGHGMEMAHSLKEAKWRQRKYQSQLHPKSKVKYSPTNSDYGA